MKTVLSLLLLSASSSSVYSIDNAEVLNFNLRHSANIQVQGPSNKHQCYNHCERHTSKSTQWIDNCKRQCDEQYDPPTGQCYNLGDSCGNDEDCQTGGYNPCTKCGDKHGTEYYKRCYGEAVVPTPPPEPTQCYNLGESCERDSDCHEGGTNFCTKCGTKHGTRYYKQCYGGNNDEEEDAEDIVVGFLETDEESQCYNLGDHCQSDEDCQTGGYNPCTTCGDQHGTEYYHRCYGGEEPAPTPAPEPPQCYNHGDHCHSDEDCQTGGYNPCTICGDQHGTEYYHRCYGGEEPAPTPAPEQCYNLGDSCSSDEDCQTGGYNPCTKCGDQHGTEYYKRCYGEENAVVEFLEDDGHGWDDIKNATEDGWDDTKKGTEQAAKKTADWSKNAADKTKDWGKKTFDDPDSSGYEVKSGAMLVAVGSLAMHVFLV